MTTLTAATPSMGGGMAVGGRPRITAPGAPGGNSLAGADILRVIRQRLVMIILVWILLIGATIVGTYFWAKYRPSYKAMSLLRVESVDPINLSDPLRSEKMTEDEQSRAVTNQTLFLKSPLVLSEALKDPQLQATNWYREASIEFDKGKVTMEDLLDDCITASPIRQSSYFTVSASWKIPTEVPTLVNTVVAKYLFIRDEQQKKEIRDLNDSLSKEKTEAQKLFDAKNADIQQFRSTWSVLGQGTEPNEKLQTLEAIVTELELDALGKEALWEQLQNMTPESMPLSPELQALLSNDRLLAQYEADVQQIEESLRRARQQYGNKHRAVIQLEQSYQVAKQRLDEETAVKTLTFNNQQLSQAQQSYLRSQEMLLKANDSLAKVKAEQRDKDTKMAEYLQKLEDRDSLRIRLETLTTQQDIVAMQLRQTKQVRIKEDSPAQTPRKMSLPRWELMIPAGTVLGFMVAVGLALLLDIMDKSVRTPRDIARQAGIPVLGTIPTSQDDEIEIERVETASIDAPHSIIAEAFRQLRANLFFSAPAEQQGVLMVSSPSGGNGKTTVATNLAIAIALSGRRVLLIDANFRRAALPRIFPQIRQEGLSNILIGQSRLSDLVTGTAIPGLDVLGSGPTPPNPAELLGSSYLRDLVVDARSRYDQVIFDGPPVLLVSDAMVLAGAVDGVLLVCQYRSTSRGALQRARTQLEAINSRIFGAVLNMVETRAGGYFRKHYREFYEYHEREDGEDVEPSRRLEPGGGAAAAATATAVAVAAPQIAEEKREPEPDDAVVDLATIRSDDDIAAQIEAVGDVRLDDRLALGDDLDQMEIESQTRPGDPNAGVAEQEIAGLGENVELDPDYGLDDGLKLDNEFDQQEGDDNLGWTNDEDDPNNPPGR